MKTHFSKTLKKLMDSKDLNQLSLSKQLGIRQSQISNWLNCKTVPNYYSIKMLTDFFEISADELFEKRKAGAE